MVSKYLSKTVYVPEEYIEIFEDLEKYAKKINRSQSYIICEAVREYIEKVVEETKKYIKS